MELPSLADAAGAQACCFATGKPFAFSRKGQVARLADLVVELFSMAASRVTIVLAFGQMLNSIDERNKMKKVSTTVLGGAGLLYGLLAVLLAYRDAPVGLQTLIVAGVAATGASVGWIVGLAASLLRQRCRTDRNSAA